MSAVSPSDLDALAGFLMSRPAGVAAAELSAQLGWNRGRTAAAVTGLRELGAAVEETDAGLRLRCDDPLVAGDIVSGLARIPRAALEVCRVCASTNDRVRDGQGVRLCVAEAQTSGRGRRGQTWLQPFGTGLALSLGTRASLRRPEGMAIALAVCVAEALADGDASQVGLKWPNDFYLGDRKLGGLMVEASNGPPARVVVGVGLNVHAVPDVPGRAVAALAELGPPVSRSRLAARVAEAIVAGLEEYEAAGLAVFVPRYAARDVLSGRRIRLREADHSFEGVARGIGRDGALTVETERGWRHCFSGEVSTVRAVDGAGA